jgi:hypothetical protein
LVALIDFDAAFATDWAVSVWKADPRPDEEIVVCQFAEISLGPERDHSNVSAAMINRRS